jgi:hypothetical protein
MRKLPWPTTQPNTRCLFSAGSVARWDAAASGGRAAWQLVSAAFAGLFFTGTSCAGHKYCSPEALAIGIDSESEHLGAVFLTYRSLLEPSSSCGVSLLIEKFLSGGGEVCTNIL